MSRGHDNADQLKTRHIDVLIGEKLRELRKAQGLSRGEVADKLGVSTTRIQNYEDGDRIPASRLWQFCALHQIDIGSLFQNLPHHVGPGAEDSKGATAMPGLAEPYVAFDHDAPDDMAKAIERAVSDLSRTEQHIALAALRGMGQARFKRP